jgi:hypothetical protein
MKAGRVRRLRLFPFLLALPATQVAAQATPPVSVGARVRAHAPAPGRADGWLVGTAVGVDRARVEIREDRSGQIWSVPFTTTRLQVSRGIESARYGAVAGAVGGFLVGEIAGFLLLRPTGGKSTDLGTRALERLRSPGVLMIGGIGAVSGFLIGRRVRGERWEPIVVPIDVGGARPGRNASLGLAWRR